MAKLSNLAFSSCQDISPYRSNAVVGIAASIAREMATGMSKATSTSLMIEQRMILQLRDHFRRIPIGVHGLNLAIRVHFKDIDAFEIYFFAVRACAVTGPLHR